MSVDSHSLLTSRSLIRRAQSFEPEALDTVVRLYTPVVYHWVRSTGLSPSDTEDVVQNIFVGFLRRADRFSYRQENASFRAWLWTVSRNAVLDFRRRELGHAKPAGGSTAYQQIQQVADVDDWSSQSSTPAVSESILLQESLRLLKQQIDARTWDIFSRTAIGSESATDVAEELGMTPKAVRQAKYRVLCRLRSLMADT